MEEYSQDTSSDSCCSCNSCRAFCLRLCCCCCKDLASDGTKQYPHVLYGQLPTHHQHEEPSGSTGSSSKRSYSKLASKESYSSVGKQYKYPQKYREYNLPPQLTESDDDVDLVVREQPRATMPGGYDPHHPSDRQSYRSSESYGEEDSEDDVYSDDPEYVRSGRNPSIVKIERSPENTLKRGQHLEFPKQQEKKMSLNMLRPLDASLLKKLEELKPEASPAMAGVHFSLYFDETKSMLIVHVNQAVNLPTHRPAQTSNPFIQTYLLPGKLDVQQSHCVDGTHSPVFDRVFRFVNLNIDNLRRQLLVIRFYINVNHLVGGVLCSLEDANLTGDKVVKEIAPFDEDTQLQESFQGDILLTICYHSRTGILEILILEISNLKRQDILRLPNPYVKINLIYRGQRLSKWKTSTKKGTSNPVYNEICEIDISSMNVEDVQFDVVVMNYDRLGHNNEIGSVSFGDISSNQSGQEHWKKIMINTNTEVSHWHPLLPSQHSTDSSSRSSSPSPKHQPKAVQSCFRVTPGMQL